VSRLTNIGKAPVRLGNIILFDLNPHRLDPAAPIYGEGFQKLAQTSGPLGKPDYFGAYPDATHYHIPQPDGLPSRAMCFTSRSRRRSGLPTAW